MEKINSTIKNEHIYHFVIKKFGKYLLIGFLLAMITKAAINFYSFRLNFINNFLIEGMFLSSVYLLDEIIFQKIISKYFQYIIAFFSSGIIGLIGIEWFINGNLEAGIVGNIFLFLFRATIATLSMLIVDDYGGLDERYGFVHRLLILHAIFVFVAGFMFVMFRTELVLHFFITLYYIITNIFLWREIFRLKEVKN